jgi:copper chaperone CopZ
MTSPFWNELAKAVETVEAYPDTHATIDLDGRIANIYVDPARSGIKYENEDGTEGVLDLPERVIVVIQSSTATSTTDKVLDEKQIIGFGGKHSTDGKKR